MKIYKVNSEAATIYYRSIDQQGQWKPSADERLTQIVLTEIQGKEFPAFHQIQASFEGRKNLHIGKNFSCKSEIFTIPESLIEEVGEVEDYDPPIEETKSGWWKEQGFEVVRLFVAGFTDGFMAFVKK